MRVALALAALALLAAAVAAAGPAERQRATFAWPPPTLPPEEPSGAWYTPLLLVARTPERLEVRIPCRLARPLPDAAREPLVLATARHPTVINGLSVRLAGRTLSADVGRERLTRLELPVGGVDGCAVSLSISGREWSATGARGERRAGTLTAPLEVTSLFSELDLRAGSGPRVTVTTKTTGTRQVTRQRVAAALAALAAVAALLLASGIRPTRLHGLARRVRSNARIDDGVVAAVLLAWWILAPTPYDDGWVKAREDAYGYLGEFSNYYDHFAASLPLAYWLEWVERAAVSSADGLAIGRIPAVTALAAGWVLCRASARLALGDSADRLALRVVLVVVYLAFAMAWGMTLRPEPFVAALAGASLLGALRFVARPSAGPIAAFAVLVPLGVTIHPIGLVTIAPIVAVAPAILGWARRKTDAWLACGVAAVSAASLALVLFTLDADLAARRASGGAFRSSEGYGLGYRDELSRYDEVLTASTSIQSMFVLVLALALVLYATRSRSARTAVSNVPARSLAVAMVLLAFTPSKISWHLGVLIVIGAVAVAVESQVSHDRSTALWPSVRGYLGVCALLAVAWWMWRSNAQPNKLAVRTEGWRLRTEDWITLTQATVALCLLVLAVVAVREMRRRGWLGLRTAGIAAFPYVLVVVVVCVAGFTLDRLAEDALFGKGWTLSRQNVDTLLRRETCGLADDAVLPDRGSFTPLQVASGRRASESTAAGRPAAVAGVASFRADVDGVVSPWYRLPASREVGVHVNGFPRPADVVVEWGEARPAGPRVVGRSEVRLEGRGTVVDKRLGARFLPWRFVTQGDLSSRPATATLARARATARPGSGAVTVSAPIAYDTIGMAKALSAGPHLVGPNFVVLFPCARLPSIAHGVHEVPRTLLVRGISRFQSMAPTGSAYGLLDLYQFNDLPTTDSARRTSMLRAYVVDTRIPGAALAPAELTISLPH